MLRELSVQGHLSHLLHLHRQHPAARASLISAIVLSNPTFERPSQFDQSQEGDKIYNQLLPVTSPDGGELAAIAEVISVTSTENILFGVAIANKKVRRLAAAIMGAMARRSYRMNIDVQKVAQHVDFACRFPDLNPIEPFLINLNDETALFPLLSAQPFEIGKSDFYEATLALQTTEEYVKFIQNGLLGVEKARWDKALAESGGNVTALLELASRLKGRNPSFTLSQIARDAALDRIRAMAKGDVLSSEEDRERLRKLVGLLSPDLRASLVNDIEEDLFGPTDSGYKSRMLDYAGEHVSLEREENVDRIVRRIFSPVVGSPTERSASWIAELINRRAESFRELSPAGKNEFGNRLRTAIQTSTPSDSRSISFIVSAANLLDIDLGDMPAKVEAEGKP